MLANYWLNIDIPTRNWRLHKDNCRRSRGKYKTALKGVGNLRRDGGWLEFKTEQERKDFFQKNFDPRLGFELTKYREWF